MKPSPTMNGRRSAASSGGRSAFSTATTAAIQSASQRSTMLTPGRMIAATSSAIAVRNHEISSRTGLNFGLSGSHETGSPYSLGAAAVVMSSRLRSCDESRDSM